VTSELKEGQPYLVEACVNEMCRSGTLEVAEDRVNRPGESGDLLV